MKTFSFIRLKNAVKESLLYIKKNSMSLARSANSFFFPVHKYIFFQEATFIIYNFGKLPGLPRKWQNSVIAVLTISGILSVFLITHKAVNGEL